MSAEVTLHVNPAQATIAPGGRLEVVVTLSNTSELVDRYRVTVAGIPAEWCEPEALTASLFPGQAKALRFTLLPPEGSGTAAGLRPVTISAVSESDETIRTIAEFPLTIQGSGALQFDVLPKRVSGRRAQFRADLINQSNGPLSFSFWPETPKTA